MNFIIDTLKLVKPFFRAKGLDFQTYGRIKDNKLTIFNGFVQVETPINLSFNCCVSLNELLLIMQSVGKQDFTITENETCLQVVVKDNTYQVPTKPVDILDRFFKPTVNDFFSCQDPQVFKTMCKVAEPFLERKDLNYPFDHMAVCNGVCHVTDKYSAVQAILDYSMPNFGLSYAMVCNINACYKYAIKGFNLIDDLLVIAYDNDVVMYVPVITGDRVEVLPTKLDMLLNRLFSERIDLREFPDYIKHQLALLSKMSVSKTVFFNNHFATTDQSKVDYPVLEGGDFAFKGKTWVISTIINYVDNFNLPPNEPRMLFTNNSIQMRGVLGGIVED